MPGRFYFAPVSNGLEQLGAGIGGGLADVGAGIAARQQRKRLDADTKKEDDWKAVNFAMGVNSAGGGMGQAPPAVPISNSPATQTAQAFTPYKGVPQRDPNYSQMHGPTGDFYLPTADYKRKQAAQATGIAALLKERGKKTADADAAEQSRKEKSDAIFDALNAMHGKEPNFNPTAAHAAADAASFDEHIWDHLYPKPDLGPATLAERTRHDKATESIGQTNASRLAVGANGEPSPTQALMARKQVAIEAAKALAKLKPGDYDNGAAYGQALTTTARAFGFDSPDDHLAEMKALGLRVGRGVGAPPKKQTPTGKGAKVASDSDVADAIAKVGTDAAKVRAELKRRGLSEQ